jgi:hypothetical protein
VSSDFFPLFNNFGFANEVKARATVCANNNHVRIVLRESVIKEFEAALAALAFEAQPLKHHVTLKVVAELMFKRAAAKDPLCLKPSGLRRNNNFAFQLVSASLVSTTQFSNSQPDWRSSAVTLP